MIKINLLPIRAARKRESVKQQLILFAVLIFGAVVGLYLWYSSVESKIEKRKKLISSTQQQIEQYKKAIGEVEKFRGLEDLLKQKLAIIDKLEKGKSGPVKVLDRMSQVIPKQVWLTAWKEKGNSVTLEGEALSNKYVAQFISALKEPLKKPDQAPIETGTADTKKKVGKYFNSIKLVSVEAFDDNKANRSFVKFKISFRVDYAI